MLSNHLNFPSRPDPYAAAHVQATLIGERLSLEKLVASAVERAAARARNPFEWGGASLGKGHTGVALLQLALARHAAAAERVADATTATGGVSSEEWLTRAQAQLHSAVGSTHTHPLTSTSVLLGSSGLAMAVADFQQTDDRYATSASRLWQQVAEQVRDHPWPVRESGYAATDYDVVYGAAGVLVALLSSPEALSGQRDAVDILVSLSPEGGRPLGRKRSGLPDSAGAVPAPGVPGTVSLRLLQHRAVARHPRHTVRPSPPPTAPDTTAPVSAPPCVGSRTGCWNGRRRTSSAPTGPPECR